MKKIFTKVFIVILLLVGVSCQSPVAEFDATGSFEAEQTIISSEAQGVLKRFDLTEGQILEVGEIVGVVDSVQLSLKKKQLEAQVIALLGKKPNIPVQLSALQEQLKVAKTEEVRIGNLVKGDAATPKQWDDIKSQIILLQKQIDAQRSTLDISSASLLREMEPLQIQIEQIEDQLQKCQIENPVKGTVLSKYVEVNEMVGIGKPLYKIADLSTLILRAYVTGDQLAQLQINQRVRVSTDDGVGGMRETDGSVIWISDKAEFTPKTIQTKEERANRVYAIKVKVTNDGFLKIGMYGEVKFH